MNPLHLLLKSSMLLLSYLHRHDRRTLESVTPTYSHSPFTGTCVGCKTVYMYLRCRSGFSRYQSPVLDAGAHSINQGIVHGPRTMSTSPRPFIPATEIRPITIVFFYRAYFRACGRRNRNRIPAMLRSFFRISLSFVPSALRPLSSPAMSSIHYLPTPPNCSSSALSNPLVWQWPPSVLFPVDPK